MEILKNKLVIALICIATGFSAVAQEKTITAAFSESYTYENKGDYTNALKSISPFYDENSYEINMRMGWLKYMAGMFTESVTYYEKAISLKPMSEEARLGIAMPVFALGNTDQLVLHYQKILENNPYQTTVLYRMGLIYYNKGDYTRSYSYLEKLVNLYPFTYDGLLLFAWTNLKLGKTNEAKVLFNKTLLLSPGDSSATEGLSLIK